MKYLFLAILSVAGMSLQAGNSAEDTATTIVVYNVNDPEAKGLADFYCASRGIAPSREIPLHAPLKEEISRDEYDTSIATPLRKELIRRGSWLVTLDMMNRPILYASTIRYVALIRGIPLKISRCAEYPGDSRNQPDPHGGCNAASVDSELSVLGLFSPQISGTLHNPLYQESFLPRGEQEEGNTPPLGMLFVSRLDAPTVEAVKAMISNGIKAEKEGLMGWGYTDLRSVGTQGYERGDRWIKDAGEAMRRNGIPVITDDLPETMHPAFPVTHAAAYYGWYAEKIDGPFAHSDFRFVPGAVAVHLHSYSASTLRDPTKGWTAPLLIRGASASLGNVYEPFLPFTTNLGIFASALMEGRNLAESYYAAQPVLSWMNVCVGDPLYRPYASWYASEPVSASLWSDYRSIILAHGGDVLSAAADLRSRSEEKSQSLYLEALGAAQLDAGAYAEAEGSFKKASIFTNDPAISFRLLLEQSRAIEKQGRGKEAASLLMKYLSKETTASRQALLVSWIKRMEASTKN
jgi:uncharacterized protein (TIGR03790 family)